MTKGVILLVEDDPVLRMLLTHLLKEYEIRGAGSLAEAREAWRNGHEEISLFLLDVELPDGTSTEFHREVEIERGCPIPTVAMTGGCSEKATRYWQERHIRVLSKPHEVLHDLLSVIARLLESSPRPVLSS